MEFMKIGHDSLKITMSAKEAKMYDLDEDSTLDSEEMKSTFTKLLLRAKKEIGYKYAGERVVAEIFSSKNGGCEIFLSYADEQINEMKESKYKKSYISVYMLESFFDTIELIKRMEGSNYKGKSSLYYDEQNERYYIAFEDPEIKDGKYLFINEYARQQKNNSIVYLKEHCKCIKRNTAIDYFSCMK